MAWSVPLGYKLYKYQGSNVDSCRHCVQCVDPSKIVVLEATVPLCITALNCIFQGWWRVLKEPGGRNAIMDLELKEDRTRKIE